MKSIHPPTILQQNQLLRLTHFFFSTSERKKKKKKFLVGFDWTGSGQSEQQRDGQERKEGRRGSSKPRLRSALKFVTVLDPAKIGFSGLSVP